MRGQKWGQVVQVLGVKFFFFGFLREYISGSLSALMVFNEAQVMTMTLSNY